MFLSESFDAIIISCHPCTVFCPFWSNGENLSYTNYIDTCKQKPKTQCLFEGIAFGISELNGKAFQFEVNPDLCQSDEWETIEDMEMIEKKYYDGKLKSKERVRKSYSWL